MPNDLELIKQLEKEIGNELKAKDERIGYISTNKGNKGIGEYYLDSNGSVITLVLGNLQLKNFPRTVLKFKNLQFLSLYYNQINTLPPEIGQLTNLTFLYLGSNQLSTLPPEIGQSTNLISLYLDSNQLGTLPSDIEQLTNLKILDLHSNQLNTLPSGIKQMTNLEILRLSHNNLTTLPHEIGKLTKLTELDLCDNPLKQPPVEIANAKDNIQRIQNYFEQLKEQAEDYLFEAKLLIVGEPGAGKTSMTWKIENSDCDLPKDEETTKGIDVRQYYFPLRKEDFPAFEHPEKLKNRKFRVNLWDFGGQEIYKATHRFFLSRRSLYALVADSRNEDTDFNYWLHIAEMFGGESPLLIVLNEKYQRKRNIDIAAMKKRFTNISQVLDVDFAEDSRTRLNKLKKAVRYYISQLPFVGSPVPAKWTVVREALEKDKRNTITLQDYLDICEKNGIAKTKDALVLSQYFHDIGVFLHFQDDSLLKKTIFLRPNWATHAVYQILDHDLIKQQNGSFNKNNAKTIWSEDEYEFLHDELLRLMQKFFLTYKIGDSDEYIAPEHLPAEQPKYDWDEKNNLFLYYKYDLFMPKGIMSLFTVRMHRNISNHDRVWKKGVVLERDNTFAEVIETYDARRIKIRVSGKNKRDFMTIITEEIDRINSQYEKMKVEKMIPCNCDECKTAERPYFFEHNKLKRRLENNIDEIECDNSYKRVKIRNLIDEVVGETIVRNKVFVSYSQKDKKWLERVQTHLKVLEHEGITINLWDDTKIKAGMKWHEEITKALSAAKVAILLVSTDFLASDFICTDELPPLLKAAEKDGATILPLILKPCRFTKHATLSEFQAVNNPANPFSKLEEHEQDEFLVNLADRIAELMKEQ